MERDRATDRAAARKQLDEMGARHLWIAYTDYNGRTQAKSLPASRFESALRSGPSFARANLDFNLMDHMVDDAIFTADTGDFLATPDLDTLSPVPWVPHTARTLAWMRDSHGNPWDGCPRHALQRQLDAYAEQGYTVRAAYEPELCLFRRTAEGSAEPADRTGMFTLDGLDAHAELFAEISETLEAMGVDLEQLAPEYGQGQIEINIRHAPALKAADDLVTLRDAVKAIARRHGLIATFMPKPFAHLAGSGLHVHLSLWSANGEREMFAQPDRDHGLSDIGLHFIAGLLRHAPALTGLGAPTVNSYKRLLPGSWAPAHAVWGIGNRSAMVRVPAPDRPRVEVRCGDNTAQPYVYLAGLLAAGLDGIERQELPPAPANEDVGHLSSAEANNRGLQFLPRSAGEALDAVEADTVIAGALGATIHCEWLKVKRSELAAYATEVSAWERQVYLES
jgi:glutamine synthetase